MKRVGPRAPLQGPARDPLFLRACRGEPVERVPVWLMRQAGRYQASYRALRARVSMLDLCKSPDLAAKVTVDAVEQLGVDAAILFSDLLLPAEALGFRLSYPESGGPLIRPRLETRAQVRGLRPDRALPRLSYVSDAVRRARGRLPEEIPLIGFTGAPFTLAAYLIEGGGSKDFVRTKAFMRHEPGAWHLLLERLSELTAGLLIEQISAGAQAVQLFDSWAGILSPSDYRAGVLPHTRSVFRAMPRGVPSLLFGTQTGAWLPLLKEAGPTVVGVDWRVPLDRARQALGETPVMGNLDPTLLFGPPAAIRAGVRRVLREGARPGHIFNLGHGILPGTPFENVVRLVRFVKSEGGA